MREIKTPVITAMLLDMFNFSVPTLACYACIYNTSLLLV